MIRRTLALFAFLCSSAALAQSLNLTVTTTSHGGQYSPRNIVAVWIVGPDGNFVKTIGRWAGIRASHLKAWQTPAPVGAGTTDVDAISGATRSNHNSPLNITWDLKNKAGTIVPDGNYTIRMELCDSNANAASQNAQGTFTFTKGPTDQTQNTSGAGFTVTIRYTAPVAPPMGGGTGATGGGTGTTGGGTAATGGGTAATGGGTAATGGGTAATGGGSAATGGGTAATGGGTAGTGGSTGTGGGAQIAQTGCTSTSAAPGFVVLTGLLILRRRRQA
jgi:hypothetical protein